MPVELFATRALLLRSAAVGESHLMLTYLTEAFGMISVGFRGGRASQKRGALAQALGHTLTLSLERTKRGNFALKEAELARSRLAIASSLAAMEALGRGLIWVRTLLAPDAIEREVFANTETFLDVLMPTSSSDQTHERALPKATGHFGMLLLGMLGFAPNFSACVRCDRLRPNERKGTWFPEDGGLLCQSCRARERSQGVVLPGEVLTSLSLMQEQPLTATALISDDSLLDEHMGRVIAGLDRAIDWAQR
jgi:recombinational DNA repair protein (RecF pathway)